MNKFIALLALTLWCAQAQASYVASPYEVFRGGTGDASTTAYGVIAGGTSSTGAFQNVGTGTSGQVLTSNGSSSLATWQTPTVYANQALSNLTTTSINASLLPASALGENVGSAALPWGTVYEGILELMGSTSGNVQIQAAATTTPWTITLPAAVCSSGQYWADNGSGVYSCTTPAMNGANTALSNLASVAINTSLLPASAGSANLGSAAKPFGTSFDQVLELMGSTSGNFQLQAAAVTTSWTATAPAAVCASGQYWADNGSGVYSCTTPSIVAPTVVNGGNAAYAINAGDGHIRSGTTLTAQRTYTLDACTTNIGERHVVKNLASQTFNIVVAGNGSDTVDGSANYTLYPGDSVSVICAVSGYWDIE
jgi:hypothetical protein